MTDADALSIVNTMCRQTIAGSERVCMVKEEHFHLRVDAAEKALVRCAAREAGVSASRFMREAAVRAAEEAVARQNRFVVPLAQWADFAAALDGDDPDPRRSPASSAEEWLRNRDPI
jgi:uncharacterized protein (DUF1778 family)